MPIEPKSPEQLRRQASRVVMEAAIRGRKGLVDRLTANKSKEFAKLLRRKPVFFEREEHAPEKLLIDEEIQGLLPEAFFKNPTKWIESQKNIERHAGKDAGLPTGETIRELWKKPYDISRVKEFEIPFPDGTVVPVVSKRIKPEDLEEIATARNAYEAGIPTPRVLAEIYDQGNVYAWFELIPSMSLLAIDEKYHISELLKNLRFLENRESRIRIHTYINSVEGSDREKLDGIFNDLAEIEFHINNFDLLVTEILRLMKEEGKEVFSYRVQSMSDQEIIQLGEQIFMNAHASRQSLFNGFFRHNLDDLLQIFDTTEDDQNFWRDFFRKTIENDLGPFYKKIREGYQDSINNFITIVCKGINFDSIIKELEILCREKGVTHKDFNDRNILIEWDFTKDEPVRDENRKIKPLLVDWERESNIDRIKKK